MCVGGGALGWSGLKDFRIWSAFVSLCVSTCVLMFMCVSEFGAHCFREKDFVRSTRPGGGYGHGEKTEHQAPLFSALGFVTSPAVSQRSVEGETTPGSADEA